MFESILRHKQVVIAAIAITALAGYVIPLNQFAAATILTNDGTTDDDTNIEDSILQEGTSTATGEQNPRIDADNTQTNAIVTGDASASQTNTATSRANAFSAAVGGDAIGGDGGDDKCGDCDKKDGKKKWDDSHKKDSKDRHGSNGGGGGGDGGFAIGGFAESEADATSSATVRDNINVADTSADDNTQSNSNTQSFDLDLDQDVESEVEQEAFNINDNYFNLDLGFDD